MSKTINAFILKDFKDAGTGQQFTKGETPAVNEGDFTNYKAARLARVATAAEIKAGKPDAAA